MFDDQVVNRSGSLMVYAQPGIDQFADSIEAAYVGGERTPSDFTQSRQIVLDTLSLRLTHFRVA